GETQRDQAGRVAFIAGKKLGCAVVRNRSKRVLRAVAREAGLPAVGYDVVLVANARTRSADHEEVAANLGSLLKKAHVR
ncbi:MAG: ribonuclease P protein component, partial [Coriobacteriia bacterium]|nr:ribonuclease P protein component [Coriobacteriia bacterium]